MFDYNKLKPIDKEALICPFCQCNVIIDDRDINDYNNYDAYTFCPNCNANAVITVAKGHTQYPVEYYYDEVSKPQKIFDPRIDKFI